MGATYDPVAGGEALLVLDIGRGVNALAVFNDPTMGAARVFVVLRIAWKVHVFDPVSGGDGAARDRRWLGRVMRWSHSKIRRRARSRPLVPVRTERCASSAWSQAARRLLCSTNLGGMARSALTAFTDPATGELRLVSQSHNDVRVWNPAAGGAAIEEEPEGHSDERE